jgi:transcriptional regulator with XRE-family HTH domain
MSGPDIFNPDDFARRVRVRIAERGISQATCAKETGISKATVSRICSGKKSPDVESYLRLVRWMEALS